jgi:uncharacterized protein
MTNDGLQLVTTADVSGSEPLAKALLALNKAHAEQTDVARAGAAAASARASVPGATRWKPRRFLLALDQGADYDSLNFFWFRSRYQRLVYVNRIVVAASAQGRGCARRLYHDLFEHAVRSGHTQVFSRSIQARRIRSPTLSMLPWDLSRSTAPASTTAAGRCGICRGS